MALRIRKRKERKTLENTMVGDLGYTREAAKSFVKQHIPTKAKPYNGRPVRANSDAHFDGKPKANFNWPKP